MKTACTFLTATIMACLSTTVARASDYTPQNVARIAGSIAPTTQQTTPRPLRNTSVLQQQSVVSEEPAPTVQAVCMSNNAMACGAITTSTSTTACTETSHYDDESARFTEPSNLCRGKYGPSDTHAAHVAYCDVDDVGFSACLARYASVLVKHLPRARYSFSVTLRNRDGVTFTQTVLVSKTQTAEDAMVMALRDAHGAVVVAIDG